MKLFGTGFTEWGVLAPLQNSQLWSPSPSARELGSVEMLIDFEDVLRTLHRHVGHRTTLVRIDSSDGSYLTLRILSNSFDEAFGEYGGNVPLNGA